MTRRGPSGWWAVLAMLVAMALAWWWATPPAPLSTDAPAHVPSAGRAMHTLERLLDGVGPHPVGSGAARVVEDRLLNELYALGLRPRVATKLTCSGNTCVPIRNIEAVIPGQRRELPAVLLSAHYDSVRAGPGYGDDGAGIASLLEVARALLASRPLRRDVVLLFNEGEELGLWGADAFRRTSHHRERVHAVINVEARGTAGPSYLFQMSGPTGPLARSWARHARSPSGSSLYVSVYEQLPNGTDLAVYQDADYTGYNLAFLEGGEKYHTPLDDRAHLAPGSVQHHLDQTLSLVLAASELPDPPHDPADDAVFFDVLGLFVAHWPMDANPVLLALGLVLAGAGGLGVWLRRRLRLAHVAGGVALVLLFVLVAVGSGAVWEWLLLAAGASWRTLPELYRATLWLGVAAAALGTGWLATSTVGADAMRVGVLLVHAILAAVVVLGFPGGAYLVLLPLVALGLNAGARAALDEGPLLLTIEALLGITAAIWWLRLAVGLETAIGLTSALVTAPLALGLLPVLPLLRSGPGRIDGPTLLQVAALALLCGLLRAPLLALPDHDDAHPYGLRADYVVPHGWTRAENQTWPFGGPHAPELDPPTALEGSARVHRDGALLTITPRPGVDTLDVALSGPHMVAVQGQPKHGSSLRLLGEAPNGVRLTLSSADAPVEVLLIEGWQAEVELPPGWVPMHSGLRVRERTVHRR